MRRGRSVDFVTRPATRPALQDVDEEPMDIGIVGTLRGRGRKPYLY